MENKLLSKTSYQIWTGFDEDNLELFADYSDKEAALMAAENCYDFADLVQIKEIN
mgnify:CR=1 FL=1